MTNLTQYEKGCSPCAIQRKYGLTYAQGYEMAERLRKTQELELENAQLKELLKECKQWFDWYHIDTGTGKEYIESWHKKGHEIHKQIDEALK